MKKHLSVLMLYARCTIVEFILLLAALAVVEGGLFYFTLQQMLAAGQYGFELAVLNSRLRLVFVLGLCLLLLLLSRTGRSKHSRVDYTLRRLSLDYHSRLLWHCLYNAVCVCIYTAVQIILVLLLFLLYRQLVLAEHISAQTLMLAFYRNSFLHTLLPLSTPVLWISHLLYYLAAGTAATVWHLKGGKRGGAVLICMIFSYPYWGIELQVAGTGILYIFLWLLVLAACLKNNWKELKEDEV